MIKKILNHYDYQDIEVKKHFKWLYLDYYPCFGWDVLETMPCITLRLQWQNSSLSEIIKS